MAPLILFLAVVELVEIVLLVLLARVIGAGATLLLIVVEAALGVALVKHQGRRSWWALRRALAEHRRPGREVGDGVLVLLGGALLIAPGLLSDLAGLLCLLPPTRALLRPAVVRWAARRWGQPTGKTGWRARPEQVIEGEVLDPGLDGPR